MKNLIRFGIVGLLTGAALRCVVAGSMTNVVSETRGIYKMTVGWSMTTNRMVSGTLTTVSGELLRFGTPWTGVTNKYDVYLYDAEGVDLLKGTVSGIHHTNLYAFATSTLLPIAVDGNLTLVVSNYLTDAMAAYDVTNGAAYLYYR